jgi:nicotinate phosphoribosyltransferase
MFYISSRIFGFLIQVFKFISRLYYMYYKLFSDLKYIRDQFSEKFDDLDQFIEYLKNLNCDSVKIYAIQEGTVVFPRVELL